MGFVLIQEAFIKDLICACLLSFKYMRDTGNHTEMNQTVSARNWLTNRISSVWIHFILSCFFMVGYGHKKDEVGGGVLSLFLVSFSVGDRNIFD